jgi:inner membrane protein
VIARIAAELGPWLWVLAGLAVSAIEIMVPRGWALALGLAALLTGTVVITLQFTDIAPGGWAVQLALFLIAIVACRQFVTRGLHVR